MSRVLSTAALQAFKQSQLRTIACSLGALSTGNKQVIAANIRDVLTASRFPPPPPYAKDDSTRILSIDMGLRNLAMCVLEVPNVPASPTVQLTPKVLAWQRILVAPPTPRYSPEAFTAPAYSEIAYNLCRSFLTKHKPHQILIERQRYRTNGAPAVQEWTIRVNMFEYMLWSCFHAFGRLGEWNKLVTGAREPEWTGSIEWVNPTVVWHSWDDWRNEHFEVSDVAIPYNVKETRKQIVTALLYPTQPGLESKTPQPTLLSLSTPEALHSAALFAPHSSRKAKQEVVGSVEVALNESVDAAISSDRRPSAKEKLDDLADCLLQGLAWVKWEECRKQLLTEEGWQNLRVKFAAIEAASRHMRSADTEEGADQEKGSPSSSIQKSEEGIDAAAIAMKLGEVRFFERVHKGEAKEVEGGL